MASTAERITKAATARTVKKGRDARSPAQIPAPGWKVIAFRTARDGQNRA
jgi:hypothetical protein